MKSSNLLKLAAVTVVAGQALSASPLDDYRWKDRLVVVALPQGAEHRKALEKLFREHRAGIEERKLKFIDISAKPMAVPFATRLDETATATLRKQYSLTEQGADAVFILIGKDGGEKSRQTGGLDALKLFTLIDGMPMRRAEIRERGN